MEDHHHRRRHRAPGLRQPMGRRAQRLGTGAAAVLVAVAVGSERRCTAPGDSQADRPAEGGDAGALSGDGAAEADADADADAIMPDANTQPEWRRRRLLLRRTGQGRPLRFGWREVHSRAGTGNGTRLVRRQRGLHGRRCLLRRSVQPSDLPDLLRGRVGALPFEHDVRDGPPVHRSVLELLSGLPVTRAAEPTRDTGPILISAGKNAALVCC